MPTSSIADERPARIAYQGEPGTYCHLACTEAFPDLEAVPFPTFEDALAAVKGGDVRFAMFPIENSVAGRVADIYRLLPKAALYIVGEHFLRVRHQLLGVKGASLTGIKKVLSHAQAIGQCRKTLRKLNLTPVLEADTAGSARIVAEAGDPTLAAIASRMAGELHGLDVLSADVEDEDSNTTRYIILAKDPDDAEPDDGPVVTSFLFRVRNVPAALYKALGGFATNGVNMTKLESYQPEGTFNASMFYADIDGHPRDRSVRLALEELAFFSSELKLLGTYLASPYRREAAAADTPPVSG